MLQGYSGKHWVQIPRKQAVFVHSWYSQSSPWEWREDEVYYVQRGCCRYVQSFIIRFFFLPQEAHQECFSERKTSDYFLFLLFCLWETEDVISTSSSELTLHPSTFTSTTFNLFVILRAWLSTLNAVDFLFLQLWAKWEKSKIKVGLWKSLKWDFEKKKRENYYFSDVFHSDRKHVTFSCRQTSRCRITELLCSFISIIIVGNVQFCTSVFVLGRLQKLRTFITTIVVL